MYIPLPNSLQDHRSRPPIATFLGPSYVVHKIATLPWRENELNHGQPSNSSKDK